MFLKAYPRVVIDTLISVHFASKLYPQFRPPRSQDFSLLKLARPRTSWVNETFSVLLNKYM